MAKQPYLVLARKWRPQTFEDVVGQEHITRTLQNALTSRRIGHAFLFIGSRGIGKTTTARILAKAMNCEHSDGPTPAPCGECDNCRSIAAGNNIDVVEIDGASNNSVEHVREIREHIRLVPSRSRYKIYIIDEVHQLSQAAFNALLKTLEEPPEHAVFILATTEAHKVPATIISRCQRYDYRRVPLTGITQLLRRILDAEGIACDDAALNAIARAADGGIRDAESILEQLISYCGETITFKDVFDVLGLVDWQVMNDLCDAILDQDIARQLAIVEDLVVAGKDLSEFVQEILRYYRNLLVCKTADPYKLLALPKEDIDEMAQRAKRFKLTQLIRLVEQFAELTKGFDSQLAQRIALETMLIRVSKVAVEVSVDAVLEKLLELQNTSPGDGAQRPPDPPRAAREPGPAPPAARREQHSEPNDDGYDEAEYAPEPVEPPDYAAPADDEDQAPEQPAASRVAVTPRNLRAVWRDVVRVARVRALSDSIWFAQGVPAGVEDGVLLLRFRAEQGQAIANTQTPAARRMMEDVLAECTTNVTSFRCEAAETDDSAVGPADLVGNIPAGGAVSPREAQAAMEDPKVAKVVELFKGRIVDIRRGSPAASSIPRTTP